MAKYRISRKAAIDLDGIWAYTRDTWSEEQAIAYYNQIYQSIKVLSGLPDCLGKSYFDVREGLWGYRVGHHIIFYRKAGDGTILVSRILYEKMDFPRHF